MCPRLARRLAAVLAVTCAAGCGHDPGEVALGRQAAAITATPAFFITGFTSASYGNPAGIAVDATVAPPLLYASDATNVPRFDLAQAVNACGAGTCDTVATGAANALVVTPANGVAVDSAGDVAVAEPGAAGTAGVELFQRGSTAPFCKAVSLVTPRGVAFDTRATPNILWVADQGQNAVLAYIGYQACPGGTINPSLTISLTGAGSPPLAGPQGVTLDSSENLWVSDTGNNRIVGYPFGGMVAGKPTYGSPLWFLGQCSGTGTAPNVAACGSGPITPLGAPIGLTFDVMGNLFVADSQLGVAGSTVAPGVVEYSSPRTVGGSASATFSTGPGGRPLAVAVVQGDLYVADMGLSEVVGFYNCAGMPGAADGTDLHCLACSSGTAACEPPDPRCFVGATGNLCVACLFDNDCPSATDPHCSPATHTCVPCAVAGPGQCGGAGSGMCCNVATTTCVADNTDQFCGNSCLDCTTTPATPVCSGGACVCTPTSCPSGYLCAGGACVLCDTSAACGPTCSACPAGDYCAGSGTSWACAPCTIDTACGAACTDCTKTATPNCVSAGGTYQCVAQDAGVPPDMRAPDLGIAEQGGRDTLRGDASPICLTNGTACATNAQCCSSYCAPGTMTCAILAPPDARLDSRVTLDVRKADARSADGRSLDGKVTPPDGAPSDGSGIVGTLHGGGCGCAVGGTPSEPPVAPGLVVVGALFLLLGRARSRRRG